MIIADNDDMVLRQIEDSLLGFEKKKETHKACLADFSKDSPVYQSSSP